MMAADVAAGYCYNSGVTMLKPNQKMFRELMSQLGSEATAKMNPAGRPPPNRYSWLGLEFDCWWWLVVAGGWWGW